MKKIAICTLNSKYIHGSLSPWCLRAGMSEYCTEHIDVNIYDCTINQKQEDVLALLSEEPYQLMAFSCYIWNISATLALASAYGKENPQCKIVLGGPEVSYHPERILETEEYIDYVLSGEGELPFAQLVTAVCREEDVSTVLGLSYRKTATELHIAPAYVSKDIPPSPYCPQYFAQLQGKISYFESSRGCPYHCAFCLSGRGEVVRYFPLQRVKSELQTLANCGTQTVKFVDRTFNSSATHCNAILSFLLEEYGKSIPKHLCFHFEMAGDILQDSTLDLLEQMPLGYVQLEIGMQSFCEKTLEAVGRKTNIPKLLANLQRLLSMHNQHLHIDLIAGLPYEDLEEFAHSFNIGLGLGADMLQLGFLKVLQGSEIGEHPEKYLTDYHKTAPYQVISTPWMSQEDFALLEKVEDVLDRLYNSGRFPETLGYLLEVTGGDAFSLLKNLALGLEQTTQQANPPSLEAYTDRVFTVASALEGVSSEILRDKLVIDRVTGNSTGILPSSLKIPDPMLRKLTIALEKNPQTARPPQGKRFVGILYSEHCGIYVDYPPKTESSRKHQVAVKYPLHKVDLHIVQSLNQQTHPEKSQ